MYPDNECRIVARQLLPRARYAMVVTLGAISTDYATGVAPSVVFDRKFLSSFLPQITRSLTELREIDRD